jgi:hypothetical protein
VYCLLLLLQLFLYHAAVVRIRPAFAGEGRYFVRVPEGTNRGKFAFEADNFSDRLTVGKGLHTALHPV